MRSRFPKICSGDTTISYNDIKTRDVIRVASAGTLTLPAPRRNLTHRIVKVCNDTAGYVTIFCLDSFLYGISSIVLPPYEATDLRVIVTGTSWSEFYWSATGGNIMSEGWSSWTPTLTWTTGTPTTTGGAAVSPVGEYKIVGGVCYVNFYVSWTDGNGATALTATLPVPPAECDCSIPLACSQLVDTTYSIPLAYIDGADAAIANRIVKFLGLSTATDAKAGHVRFSGFYPIGFADGWKDPQDLETDAAGTQTPIADHWVDTWGTAAPASLTIVNQAYLEGLAGLFIGNWTSADSNATDSFKFEPPFIPPDNDNYFAAQMYESTKDTAVHSDCEAYIDGSQATAESRCVTASTWTTGTDGEAMVVNASGIVEVVGWSSWTPTVTYTTADIGSPTTVARYTVSNGMCFFQYSMTSSDGNGCTGVEFTLPVVPSHGSAVISLMSHQTVNTTVSNPAGYIDAAQEGAGDRTVNFSNLSTFTDAVAAKLYVSGCYPVGG